MGGGEEEETYTHTYSCHIMISTDWCQVLVYVALSLPPLLYCVRCDE